MNKVGSISFDETRVNKIDIIIVTVGYYTEYICVCLAVFFLLFVLQSRISSSNGTRRSGCGNYDIVVALILWIQRLGSGLKLWKLYYWVENSILFCVYKCTVCGVWHWDNDIRKSEVLIQKYFVAFSSIAVECLSEKIDYNMEKTIIESAAPTEEIAVKPQPSARIQDLMRNAFEQNKLLIHEKQSERIHSFPFMQVRETPIYYYYIQWLW